MIPYSDAEYYNIRNLFDCYLQALILRVDLSEKEAIDFNSYCTELKNRPVELSADKIGC